MGLLDDAIREHLDLKRRHGASDDEIAQKEAEALGPARREFPRAVDEDVALDEAPAHVSDQPLEERFNPIGDPIAGEIAEPPVFDPSPAADGAGPAARAEPADTEEYRFEDEDDDDDLDEDDDDELDEDDDDLSEDDEDDEEDADEDLLVDTPEFLQDTPEHDRLWFEQKPPRDFDFD